MSLRAISAIVLAALVAASAALVPTGRSATAQPAPGFVDTVVMDGLRWPVGIEFAPDGRVFIGERDGRVLVADSLDSAPRTLINNRVNVHTASDRGMLGLAHRQVGDREWIYVSYTYDAPPGGTAPTWGSANPGKAGWEGCAAKATCIAQGRVSRFELIDGRAQPEQVLVQEWCTEFANHALGDLHFDSHGYLYVSAGDGSGPGGADIGERATPKNACGSPPGDVGDLLTAPTSQGGALVSQDFGTRNDPQNLPGTIIRIDPDTGEGAPGNPLTTSDDANERRLVAYGLRNPYRFTIHPTTGALFIGDVGATNWEEVNRLDDPLGLPVENFGWPCYEGPGRYAAFDLLDLDVCEDLYSRGPSAIEQPWLVNHHDDDPVAPGACGKAGGSGAVTGVDFYENGSYPAEYRGALFVAEYGDECIYVIKPDQNGNLDPTKREIFISPAPFVVDITTGPGGDIFYTALSGEIHQVSFPGHASAVRAQVAASATFGPVPLDVRLDASGSFGGVGELSYAWDLDGDGAHDDATGAVVDHTVDLEGSVAISVRVTDGATVDDASVTIDAGNDLPMIQIARPTNGERFRVGDTVTFSATASDPEDGVLGDEHIDWVVDIEHCPTADSCHTHPQGSIDDAASGSLIYPDHEGPYELRVFATASDSHGASTTATAVARADEALINFDTAPGGLPLVIATVERTAPYAHTPPVGASVSISAAATQSVDGVEHIFVGWSDGSTDRNRKLDAPAAPMSLTAEYEPVQSRPEGYRLLSIDGTVHTFGTAPHLGNAAPGAAGHAVAIASTPTGSGYLVLMADGSVQAFGDAPTMAPIANAVAGDTAVAIAITPSGAGYWIFTADGTVITAGDARHHGDLSGIALNAPITAAATTPNGEGYRMLGQDGGVFNFGDAEFHGSIPQILPGTQLDCPIVGLVASKAGYWLVGCDGGVFAFGDASFVGSLPGLGVVPREPVNAMVPYEAGYLLVAGDGGVFAFGGQFLGSLGDEPPTSPIIAVTTV